MAFDFYLNIHFVDREIWTDDQRVTRRSMKKTGCAFEIERISQTVSWVYAHNQRSIAKLRKMKPGCGGQAGFPHAALAAE